MVYTRLRAKGLFILVACLGVYLLLWLAASLDAPLLLHGHAAVQIPNQGSEASWSLSAEHVGPEAMLHKSGIHFTSNRNDLDRRKISRKAEFPDNKQDFKEPQYGTGGSRAVLSMTSSSQSVVEKQGYGTSVQLTTEASVMNVFMKQEQLNLIRGMHFKDQLREKMSITRQQFQFPDPKAGRHGDDFSTSRSDVLDPLERKFPIRPGFTFPQPKALRPLEEVLNTRWIRALRRQLSVVTTKQVTMVTTNSGYTDVLINWLISAVVKSKVPISSILIVCLDEGIHSLLQRKMIASVYLPMFDLLRPTAQFNRSFELVMMTRLSVMRLINHWGFDVANYDTDAILLKDPQPLYDSVSDADIIGSIGTIPTDFYMEWGITICIGVVVFRSSKKTEEYWQKITHMCLGSFDDQGNLNCGLKGLNVRWLNADADSENYVIKGITENDMNISVLPYNDICRLNMCHLTKRERLYIWHKGGQYRTLSDKKKNAREGRTWFLRSRWQYIQNIYTGAEWLQSIANDDSFS